MSRISYQSESEELLDSTNSFEIGFLFGLVLDDVDGFDVPAEVPAAPDGPASFCLLW